MPKPQPPCAASLPGRPRAALAALAMCWCLLQLSACSAPQPVTRLVLPPPPPASLAAECEAGPPYPAGDVPLVELLAVMAAREEAAADCRARHRATVEAWPR